MMLETFLNKVDVCWQSSEQSSRKNCSCLYMYLNQIRDVKNWIPVI